jgi:hypothetical protein
MTAADFGIELGSIVTSADSKKLGTVNGIRGSYFKVHRSWMTGDCWLAVGDVMVVLDDEVLLDFEKKEAGQHRIPAEVVTSEGLDPLTDRLLDDRELSQQRERMERELHQR